MDSTYMKIEMKDEKLQIEGKNVTPNDFVILVSYVIKDISNKTSVPANTIIESIKLSFESGLLDDLKALREEMH